jgi:hypothetical protein
LTPLEFGVNVSTFTSSSLSDGSSPDISSTSDLHGH